MNIQNAFSSIYFRDLTGMTFCPYRVCPIGAHSDHNLGKITGLAISKGIHIAYAPNSDGTIDITSLQFGKRVQFHIHAIPPTKQNDWADHLRGSVLELKARYPLAAGLSCVIHGELPIGGLSSSAAVIIAFLSALTRVNNILLSVEDLITIAQVAENKYVGVACGKLDQSCEVLSKKDHLLYLDTLDGSYELIPQHPNMKPYKIAIFFSGVERTLAGSAFNMRVDELKSVAYALMAYAGMEY